MKRAKKTNREERRREKGRMRSAEKGKGKKKRQIKANGRED